MNFASTLSKNFEAQKTETDGVISYLIWFDFIFDSPFLLFRLVQLIEMQEKKSIQLIQNMTKHQIILIKLFYSFIQGSIIIIIIIIKQFTKEWNEALLEKFDAKNNYSLSYTSLVTHKTRHYQNDMPILMDVIFNSKFLCLEKIN